MLSQINSLVNKAVNSAYYYVENYGWFMLVVGVILAVLWQKKIRPIIDNYNKYKVEKEYEALYHKNPDLFKARAEAQQRLIDKLQEEYNKRTEELKRKQEEKDERKRAIILQEFDSKHGHVLGGPKSSGSSGSSKSFKSDFNPLMGHGSGSTYRPPRRSPCSGGGCGR